KRGAASSTSTDAPERRALMAAQSAALPPPTTRTSNFRVRSTKPNPLVTLLAAAPRCATPGLGRLAPWARPRLRSRARICLLGTALDQCADAAVLTVEIVDDGLAALDQERAQP